MELKFQNMRAIERVLDLGKAGLRRRMGPQGYLTVKHQLELVS